MGKKRRNKRGQTKQNNQQKQKDITQVNVNEIEENTLTQAIVKAYQIIEENKKEEENRLANKAKKEWQKVIGQKEYPQNEKWYLKKVHEIRNNWNAMWSLFFFKSENVRDIRTTLGLMQLAVIGIFTICKWCLYFISLAMVYSVLTNCADVISHLSFAFATWMFARVFRIAVFEIEKMKDGNLLIAIFSGCISFVAMVVAIITLLVD